MTRLPAGADNPPSLKISHNTYEQEEKADWEFLRLSLPVTRKCYLQPQPDPQITQPSEDFFRTPQ